MRICKEEMRWSERRNSPASERVSELAFWFPRTSMSLVYVATRVLALIVRVVVEQNRHGDAGLVESACVLA